MVSAIWQEEENYEKNRIKIEEKDNEKYRKEEEEDKENNLKILE